ncbi:hypothetical protein O1611_g4006 [Lasiodiplodia mahajangana]|uniref:Uncharacterized protein n=1 Tax=Lasiodiplodia mahajangana TaxID=1108764 RepID=A0ACC2JQB1_9PEZI|nr:hypothetical protein O1611_g4006 [Lasiodiplodia mahajangana]
MAPITKFESWYRSLRNKSGGGSSKSKHDNEHLGVGNTWWKNLADTVSLEQPTLPPSRSISRPIKISAPYPISYPVEKLGEPALPAQPKSPRINPQNLGSANEALNSHSVGTWHDTLAEEPVKSNRETKNQHRRFVICERDDDDYILLKGPEPSVDLPVERSQEHAPQTKASNKAEFQEFPKFRNSKTSEERVEQPVDRMIPTIELVPPPEGDIDQVLDPRFLSIEGAYRNLLKDSNKEIRRLKRLLPLAWLVAEAEGIDIKNTTALAVTLEEIIADRDRLLRLIPLADMLCKDQGINFDTEAFEALPRALEKALKDRDAARFAAQHNRRAAERLERRIGRLEKELSDLRYDGEEDYIRQANMI